MTKTLELTAPDIALLRLTLTEKRVETARNHDRCFIFLDEPGEAYYLEQLVLIDKLLDSLSPA